MRYRDKLLGTVLGATVVATLPACATERAVVVATYEDPPPPPREEQVVYRPGYLWIHGNWIRDGNNDWRWQAGSYVRERPGYTYVPGRWEHRGSQYVWVEGGWHTRGSVVIRERDRIY